MIQRMLAAMILAITPLLNTGCAGGPDVALSEIEAPLRADMNRHDAYVNMDEALTEDVKADWLGATRILDRVLKEERAGNWILNLFSTPSVDLYWSEGLIRDVVDRHDAYVNADESLAPETKEDFLADSKIVLDALANARAAELIPEPSP